MKLLILLLSILAVSCKSKKKLVCIIDDHRCGHHYAVYSQGNTVIVDSIPEGLSGILIPFYVCSAPLKDTTPYIQYWDWHSTRLNIPEYIDTIK